MFQKNHERNNMQEVKIFSNSGKGTSCCGPSILYSIFLQTRTMLTKSLIKAFSILVNCKWDHPTPIFYHLSLKLDRNNMSKTSLKIKHGLFIFVAISNIFFASFDLVSIFIEVAWNSFSVEEYLNRISSTGKESHLV